MSARVVVGDAAWLAAKGHDVVAVEPSKSMRTAAASLHADAPIRWIDDSLPALAAVPRSGLSFDLILLSAVWMHLPASERPRAFRKLINLLKPGGLLAITLRHGPAEQERGIHPVSLEEVEALARDHGAFVERHTEAEGSALAAMTFTGSRWRLDYLTMALEPCRFSVTSS